jgi:acetylornithine deacetylase/succinyl-diaminopimelate desuccinylase family protein
MTSAAILNAVQANRVPMTEFTRQLIAIPSENPPGRHYPEALQLICRHLEQIGFEPEVKGVCVLCFVGQGERTLYFSGHYDVVPAQARSQFQPVLRGKNLFGRGSSDMKSGLAAMIYAAKAVRDSGTTLNGRIGLVFVPDEETAGPRGSRYLEERGLLGKHGIGMLTPEPTGGVVWNANRGAITLKVTVKGKPAHVGRQFEGVNAFETMMSLAQELSQLKTEVETRTTGFRIQPRRARTSILMLGGLTAGGTNFNVVPDSCWFTIDRRLNPEEDLGTEKERLISLISRKRKGRGDVEIEVLQEGKSAGVAPDTPLGQALAHSIQRVTKVSPRFEMCPGLLEIRFYADRGLAAYAYGPGLLTVSHGPKEFVPIDNVVKCSAVYALTAIDLLRPR